MFYVTFALLFVTWAGLAYLFLIKNKIKKNNKAYIFCNYTKSDINTHKAERQVSCQ